MFEPISLPGRPGWRKDDPAATTFAASIVAAHTTRAVSRYSRTKRECKCGHQVNTLVQYRTHVSAAIAAAGLATAPDLVEEHKTRANRWDSAGGTCKCGTLVDGYDGYQVHLIAVLERAGL